MRRYMPVIVSALLLSCAFSASAVTPNYSISSNVTTITVLWNNASVIHLSATNSLVSIAPDHQAVAWVQESVIGHWAPDGVTQEVCVGTLYVAQNGTDPIQIERPTSSRGIDINPDSPEDGLAWNPKELQWDSKGKYLYFMTVPYNDSGLLCQLRLGSATPRFISFLTFYRLLPKRRGSDWVEALEARFEHQEFADGMTVRDWTSTYIYTPEEMAADKYVRTVRTSSIGKDWPQQ